MPLARPLSWLAIPTVVITLVGIDIGCKGGESSADIGVVGARGPGGFSGDGGSVGMAGVGVASGGAPGAAGTTPAGGSGASAGTTGGDSGAGGGGGCAPQAPTLSWLVDLGAADDSLVAPGPDGGVYVAVRMGAQTDVPYLATCTPLFAVPPSLSNGTFLALFAIDGSCTWSRFIEAPKSGESIGTRDLVSSSSDALVRSDFAFVVVRPDASETSIPQDNWLGTISLGDSGSGVWALHPSTDHSAADFVHIGDPGGSVTDTIHVAFDTPTAAFQQGIEYAEMPDGGLVIVGATDVGIESLGIPAPSAGDSSLFATEVTTGGVVEWAKVLGSVGGIVANAFLPPIIGADGSLVVVGYSDLIPSSAAWTSPGSFILSRSAMGAWTVEDNSAGQLASAIRTKEGTLVVSPAPSDVSFDHQPIAQSLGECGFLLEAASNGSIVTPVGRALVAASEGWVITGSYGPAGTSCAPSTFLVAGKQIAAPCQGRFLARFVD